MINDKELKKEKDYLKTVLYILKQKIAGNEQMLNESEKQIASDLKYAWDNVLDDSEWAEVKLQVNRREATSLNAKNRIYAYGRMIKSAYFARIDFDDGEDVTPLYIGIATLDDDNFFYVYDWRAPISSMFYDFELGEAYYDTPNGRVSGKITLKRQYKINGDKIEQIFDTNLQVVDDILKQMLSGHTTDKMRNIVMTIQKEQNKIIRAMDSDVLLVSGPAGSGKTSVAMHRVAYLLYALKDSLKNSNILVIGPNDIFSNYISNVLPEIGEDNVYQTTFSDFVMAFLTEFKVRGGLNDIYECVYSVDPKATNKPVIYNSIKLKQSSAYISLIESFIASRKSRVLSVDDVVVDGKTIIEKSFLEKFADTIEISGQTFREQGQRIIEKILIHLDIKLGGNRAARNKIKKALENNLNRLKPKDLYLELFSDKEAFVKLLLDTYNQNAVAPKNRLTIKELSDIFDYTHEALNKGFLPFEDVSGYMYLKDRIVGFKSQKNIKQVIIDEAQDYSSLQFKILSRVFKYAKITVLGDVNQCIMPFASYSSFEPIANIFKDARPESKVEVSYLNKTYRSTTQINTFAKRMIGEKQLYNQVERNGDEVEIIKDTTNIAKSKIIADALALKQKDNTVAIITRTEAQAQDIRNAVDVIKKSSNFKFVKKTDKTFTTDKIMVIPAYLAKGLEFDIALIYAANESDYPQEFSQLFYVACTRALHKLNVYYTGTLTKLIKQNG